MNYLKLVASAVVLLASSSASIAAPATPAQDEKGKICRMEQQCHWENFKKVCVYVKVCR